MVLSSPIAPESLLLDFVCFWPKQVLATGARSTRPKADINGRG
jgi:hypothetical protein